MTEQLNNNATNVDGAKARFSLDSFKRHQQQMVATSETAWNNKWSRYRFEKKIRDYSLEEIDRIINSGDIIEQQKLSWNYFYKDGFYKRILLYYATILKYAGVLIPNPASGKSLSEKAIQKRYHSAMEYVDRMSLNTVLTNCSLRALINGAYYGVLVSVDKKSFVLLDLPQSYCRTNFKDYLGNDIVEFDVSYFLTIADLRERQEALALYPKFISSYFRKWEKKKEYLAKWLKISIEQGGVCFSLLGGAPLFLNIIPASIQYDEAVDTERERDLEEIRKIIVQKIPHLNDGGLLFEPEEAVEIHEGTVGMMKGNKNVSVLTTYADVDAIISRTAADTASNTLEKMVQNIYSEASVSKELFSSTGSSTLKQSIQNDIALMMILGNKYSTFVSNILNNLFGNSSVDFKYTILPISYYNESDYITDTFKLAQSGYSFLLPAIACGFSQRDFTSLKDLENNVLNLGELMIPLSSAYTQSAAVQEEENTAKKPDEVDPEKDEEGGRPKLEEEEKAETTIITEKSKEKQGGSK